jgi:uncharacterized protein (DUF2336 family)
VGIQSLIADFDAVLIAASNSRRVAMLRQVTDLFLDGASSYSEDHVAVFGLIIKLLIEKVERQALIELSGRLASVDTSPPDVISRLSRDDDIAIAGSILERSNAPSEKDILEVAETKGPGHLLAIACRKQISETVSDVLVKRGTPEVLRKTVGNECARFSEIGYVKLIGA